MFECMLMHEYTECYLYWSCYNDETDERIKQIWLTALRRGALSPAFCRRDAGKNTAARSGSSSSPKGGEFPELLRPFSEQKSYVREVLRSVRLTGRAESYAEVDDLPDNFRFFSYNRAVQGNVKSLASHVVIEKAIEKFGKDYRVEDKAHPIRGPPTIRSPVNADIARVKGA